MMAVSHRLIHRPPSGLLLLPRRELVSVKDSPIHGKGLFANHDLAPGDIILRMDPDKFTDTRKHPWNNLNRDILPFFVNHACEPNAALVHKPLERSIAVVATLAIPNGAEVTIDYFMVEVGGKTATCLCGSTRCRGVFPSNLQGSW